MNKELEALVLIAAHIGLLEELTDLKKGSVVEELHLLENALTRLEKLKDIEEELGIDLITLFKALKNGIWVVNQDFPLQFSETVEMYKVDCLRCGIKYYDGYYEQNYYIKFKDYGKTWALTEEELQ